jgi:hypothetical protein
MMNPACQKFLDLICEESLRLKLTEQKMLSEWLPEAPPVTTLFAAIGYEIAEDFDGNQSDKNRTIFSMIEEGMNSDDSLLGTAVATGLIEAMTTRAMQIDGLWERIVPHLGKLSRYHAEAWLKP